MNQISYFSLVLVLLFSSCKTFKPTSNHSITSKIEFAKWIKPPNLKQGDTVAILSPASPLQDSIYSIQNALDTLTSWGLNYKLSAHIFDKEGHFAGIDLVRASDLQQAINDKSIKAIWCSRGGYGSVRIIDAIDFSALKENPKWVIGYSDITVLHNEIHNNGIQSLHAVVPLSLKNASERKIDAIESLKNVLFGSKNKYQIKSSPYNKLGKATGVLIGGNLALLQSVLESKTSISTVDKILFIEEIGEKKYNIDRMLYSLKRAGYFDACKGLIVGGLTNIKKEDPSFGKKVEEIFLELLSEYNFPIVFDFPAGHVYDNRTLTFGAKVKLKVDKSNTSLLFLD